jgi:dolichol-phosphate mannosyltransferase
MSFSVILPTFNENNHIKDLLKSISDIFFKQNITFEILVVDDNSTDGTRKTVQEFANTNKNTRLITRENKKRNLASSIDDGVKSSNYKYIIWMDADFQHPPKYINKFIDLSKHKDVIVCSRFLEHSERYFNDRKINKVINENQSQIFNKLCNFLLFKDLTDFTSGFICLKKELLKNYSLNGFYGDYFVNLIVFLKKNKIQIFEIPFKDDLRATGLSKTAVKIDFKYLYLCYRYSLTLIKNLFLKFN